MAQLGNLSPLGLSTRKKTFIAKAKDIGYTVKEVLRFTEDLTETLKFTENNQETLRFTENYTRTITFGTD